MTTNSENSAVKKEFKSTEEFAEELIEYATGPESPNPVVGKIFAKHILPMHIHPDAVKHAEQELVEIIEKEEGM